MPRKAATAPQRDEAGIAFRKDSLRNLTAAVGVYVLCDLDEVPVYVGKSDDGIRTRVNRHLTSARSDAIANRKLDIWEIAWVWAYVETDRANRGALEAALYADFNARSPLMNGAELSGAGAAVRKPDQRVQVMPDELIAKRRSPLLRLPRQGERYIELLDYYLNVKASADIRRSLDAHFQRMQKYHRALLPAPSSEADADPDEP